FNKYVGMGLKKYSQIANVNHLIQNIADKKLLDLTHDYDYYDQAHLNHVFKEICETTPHNYIQNLSDFYNELYKF
ncbi:MAG: AraC family transcriptional regulator, partial [Coprobacillus sp.]